MRALVRGLALRRLRLEPGRSALLVLGVALGVSVFVAVRALNATALESLGRVGEVATGSAALVVEGGAGGVPVALLEAIRATPGVRGASPVIARFAREAESAGGGDATGPSTRRLLVLGLDLLDPLAREASEEAAGGLEANPFLLARDDAALVAAAFARRRGLALGGRFELFLAAGRRGFTVAGTFEPPGPIAQTSGGDVILLPLPLAMKAFGTPGRVDRIALVLAKEASADDVARAIRSRLGSGVEVSAPGQQALRSDALLGSMQLGLQIASLLALMIGVFLIYNAMSIAVVRRRPEIGILRAVGTTKLQLALLLFAEAAAFGIVGSALGIEIGWLLARAALSAVNAQVSQLYAALDARDVVLGPATVVVGLVAGPLATLLATAPPVWQALTVAPVEAARKDLPARDPHRAIAVLALLGLALLAASAVVFFASREAGLGLVMGSLLQAMIGGGAAACAPWGVVFVTRRARPHLARLLGPTGALAGDNLLARPGRAGVTVASLMVALGGVLAVAGLVDSLQTAIRDWVGHVIVADVYAAASTPLGSQTNTLLAPEVAEEIRSVPGVTACYPLRFAFETIASTSASSGERTAPAMLIGVDLEFLGEHAHVPVVDSIPEGLKAAVKVMTDGGDAVAVSSNFLRRRGLRLRDRISIRTPTGTWTPEVILVLRDYTSEHGTIYIDRPTFWRRWGDERANAYDIFFAPGTDVPRATEALRARFGARYDLFFSENAAFKKRVLSVVESAFSVTYAMQIVAIGVALLGVVTTLYAAILERTREVGVLRAVGASRGHIRRAVITEAFLLGAIASGFAVTTGTLLGWALVARLFFGSYGWDVAYSFPVGPAIFGAIAATSLATFAGALPAARAARISIVEALAYG
jgi:putative ABC transport system permease protein